MKGNNQHASGGDRELGDRDMGDSGRGDQGGTCVSTWLGDHHYALLVNLAKARGRSISSMSREILIKAIIPQIAGEYIDPNGVRAKRLAEPG